MPGAWRACSGPENRPEPIMLTHLHFNTQCIVMQMRMSIIGSGLPENEPSLAPCIEFGMPWLTDKLSVSVLLL